MKSQGLKVSFLTIFLTVLLFLPLIHPAFATTIFSDGFESGNFSAWTSTYGTPTVTSGNAHHGTYKAVFDANGDYIRKNYGSNQNTAYARLYLNVQTVGTSCYIFRLNIPGASTLGLIKLYNDGSNVRFQLYYRKAGSFYTVTSTQVAVSTNTWYCVELEVKCSSADGQLNGEYHVWVDGTELTDIAQTGVDTDYTYTSNIDVGLVESTTGTCVYWVDCVVVADTYIGPEAAGQEYSFTLTETVKPTSTLNIQQEHTYTFSETVIQSSILEYGAEATQTVTQTITSTETCIILQEQLYTFPQTTTFQTTLTYAAELAEVFITNIETITPHEIITYWIESPIDWSMVAIGLAALALVIAAAAIATR